MTISPTGVTILLILATFILLISIFVLAIKIADCAKCKCPSHKPTKRPQSERSSNKRNKSDLLDEVFVIEVSGESSQY
jgi:hypothetical protein